jgi:hypothetical protein
VKRTERQKCEVLSLLPSEGLLPPIEELESRLESQIATLPTGLDAAHCLYYLCTIRCSGTKCPVFCACDVVVDLEGTGDGL